MWPPLPSPPPLHRPGFCSFRGEAVLTIHSKSACVCGGVFARGLMWFSVEPCRQGQHLCSYHDIFSPEKVFEAPRRNLQGEGEEIDD